MFKIGNKVFHPLYGVMLIEDICELPINNEKQKFYVMHVKGTKIMVPLKGGKDVGLRSLTKTKGIDKILGLINKADESTIHMDWNERFKINEEKVKTGNFQELAEVVRNLYWVEKEIGLNRKEKEMYNQVHSFLVDELMLAKTLSKSNAAKVLNKALWDKGK